jgi:hypothetical protein
MHLVSPTELCQQSTKKEQDPDLWRREHIKEKWNIINKALSVYSASASYIDTDKLIIGFYYRSSNQCDLDLALNPKFWICLLLPFL